MRRFLQRIYQSNIAIKLRNFIGYKIIKVNLKNMEKDFSVSDTFLWRTDNNFKTIISYSDILHQFFELEFSIIYIYIFDNKNKLLKVVENKDPKKLNKFIINKKLLDNHEGYGTFFIFHNNQNKVDASIRNSCYTGFSKNDNLPSFVHGNLMGASSPINNGKNILKYGIMETSLFKNNTYKIQKSFLSYENIELFISNPTNRKIHFATNNKEHYLDIGESKIIEFKKINTITIKSNCFILRPIAFVYKNKYLDVFHC